MKNNPIGGTAIFDAKRKKTKFEIVMYVLAIVMVVFGAIMIYSAIAYISSYFSSYGMTMKTGWKDAIQYILSNSATWFVFALIFFGMARITARLENIKPYPVKQKMTAGTFPPAAQTNQQVSAGKADTADKKTAAAESEADSADDQETASN